MKVIFEETVGQLVSHRYHFKLYGRDHGEQYYMPYLLLRQASVLPDGLDWSIIKATDNADAIRQVIKIIDAVLA